MTIPKFDESELKVVAEMPSFSGAMIPIFDYPIPREEAYLSMMARKPVWQITGVETGLFTPRILPDNVARCFVFEANMLTPEEKVGGKDMFGIDWVYVPSAGGSIVKPGTPFLEDANEWREKLVWPNIEEWDWEGSAAANKEFLSRDAVNNAWIMNGYFERLISFMDFEGAVVALIDEDQQDAVKELMNALTDLYIKICDKYIDHYGIKAFCVHDDWGAQKEIFFSPSVCAETLVPAMRRLTDHLHSRGVLADFHSCGMNEKHVPNMIAAGWDSWTPMPMNDTHMLYEKYGDKIVLGVMPFSIDPDASEAEQRAAAVKYAESFANRDKPCTFNTYGAAALTPIFREELYKQSRLRFES